MSTCTNQSPKPVNLSNADIYFKKNKFICK